jgi:serine/threonine protein kinase/uncharacterized membrane-anchored protein YhcB (DUF1043 family)
VSADIEATLKRLAVEVPESWRDQLEDLFPDDPELVFQCLASLAVDQEIPPAEAPVPSLGAAADRRFRLLRLLDEGATAELWMAWDAMLKRNVAVKVFRHESSTVQQALDEARLVAGVVSDYTVRVLDVGDEGGRPHIVMELIAERLTEDPDADDLEIGSSAASVEGQPRSIEEAVRWTIDVARGVQAAHAHDVFHRDIKPQNIVITPKHRKARITDFGLGIGLAASNGSQMIIASGDAGPVVISGTPACMAPEQARGLAIDLNSKRLADRKTLIAVDVWGIGAFLYQLLSGRPPWPGSEAEEPWEQAAQGEPPAPLPAKYRSKRIPKRLRRVIEKAMALDPAARYARPAELAQDLEKILAYEPTSFEATSIAKRMLLWSRRNPHLTLVGLSALICAALLIASYLGVRELRSERAQLSEQITQSTSRSAMLEEQRSELEKQVAGLEAKKSSVDRELDVARRELLVGRVDLQETRALLEKAQNDGNGVQRLLARTLRTSRELRGQLEEKESDLATVKRDLEEKERQRARTAENLDRTVSDLDRTQEDLTQTENELARTKEQSRELLSQREQLILERDRARKDAEDANRALTATRGELDIITQALARAAQNAQDEKEGNAKSESKDMISSPKPDQGSGSGIPATPGSESSRRSE